MKTLSKSSKPPRLICVHSAEADRQVYYNLNLAKLPAKYHRAELMISRIHGESLINAGIPPNHIVVIAKGCAVISGDLAAYSIAGQLSVRYMFFGPGGWARFQSADRDEYPDTIHPPDEFEFIGPVIHAEAFEALLTQGRSA